MPTWNKHVFECAGPPTTPPPDTGVHWIDTVSKAHYISVGTDTVADWLLTDQGESVYETTVGASSTANISTIPLANFCSVNYKVCIHNVTEDKWMSLQLYGSKVSSVTLEDSIYSRLGESIDIDLTFKVIGTDAVLEAINNETFPVTVKYRIEIT